MAVDMYPDPERKRNRGFLGSDSSALSAREKQERQQLRYELDLNSWNLRIWGVAASGFLTDSYNLFATNVILATLSYVYFPNERWCGLVVNLVTLFGSVCGQLAFGYLADRYGRTRLYGIELVLVIVSTIGVATTSTGMGGMSFLALFAWWRFVMGVGIGAEYPLSGVITAEWSSTSSRATMIASVFLMQPVGQALAQLVGVWVLLGREVTYGLEEKQCGLNSLHEAECKKIADGIWRIVIGSGAVPALLAIIFRFFLYDCGLYTLEVKNKPGNAFRDTQRVYGAPTPSSDLPMGPDGLDQSYSPSSYPIPKPIQFSRQDLYNYFIRDKNYLTLIGTSLTWFLLDVSFYGFSLDNRGTLSDLWAATPPPPLTPALPCWNSTLPNGAGTSLVPSWLATGLPTWQTDATHPCNTLYTTLLTQAKHYLLTVSLASIAGSLAFLVVADRLPRRAFLTSSFALLTVLFLATGAVYYTHPATPAANIALVAICHFLFNCGANTLTFLIPAEVFPTAYRCTCHGVSAAAGKLGSMLAVVVVYGIHSSGYDPDTRQGLIFLLFAGFMAAGAVVSWGYLPDVQRRTADGRLEARTLEELAEGRERARMEGKVVGVGARLGEVKMGVKRRRRRGEEIVPGSAELA